MLIGKNIPASFTDKEVFWLGKVRFDMSKLYTIAKAKNLFLKLNPEFHWLRQIATTLDKFHWQFWKLF